MPLTLLHPAPRDPHAPEERPALQCPATQEAGAGQTDGPHRDRDLGGRGGAGPLGDQSLLREVGQVEVGQVGVGQVGVGPGEMDIAQLSNSL